MKKTCHCGTDKEVKDINCDEGSICCDCDKLGADRDTVKKGLDGWLTALEVEKTTYDNLDASKAINNWFVEMPAVLKDEDTSGNDHPAEVSPPSLMGQSEKLENGVLPADKQDKPIKRIQFSGGGNTMSMALEKVHEYEFTSLSCWDGCNVESETSIQGPGLVESDLKAFGAGMDLSFKLRDINIHVVHESTHADSQVDETAISFTLGDEDIDDEFVVDLYYDDHYGTVIFKTVGKFTLVPFIFC